MAVWWPLHKPFSKRDCVSIAFWRKEEILQFTSGLPTFGHGLLCILIVVTVKLVLSVISNGDENDKHL